MGKERGVSVKDDLLLHEINAELVRLRTIRDLLAGGTISGATGSDQPGKKRNLSDEARQRIVDAQKRRWALYRQAAPPGHSAQL